MERLTDGMEPHPASSRFADVSLALAGQDRPDLAALTAEFAAVLAGPASGPPPGLSPARGIELVLENGSHPRTWPIKRL